MVLLRLPAPFWRRSPAFPLLPCPLSLLPEPWKLLVSVPPVQPLFFSVDASCNGVLQHRSISPSSLLDTAISEEARQGPGLEEEHEAQEPLPGSTGRRHTLAEVSAHFSPLVPPCKCLRGSGAWGEGQGHDGSLIMDPLPGSLLQLEV